MNLSLITFKRDTNTERKVNFFADYFNHLNKNLGRYSYLEFETPLSLCSKIVFQIENNPEHMTAYLDYYLKHIFFDAGGFTNKFKYYKKLRPLIDEYFRERKPDERKEWIKNHPIFLMSLKKYVDELTKDQIEVIIEILNRILCCQHKLEEHKKDIARLTRIIASHLRLSQKREEDINRLIDKLMSRENFPLPKSVRSQKDEDNYDEIVNIFFEKHDFSSQLKGIINFIENDDECGYNLIRVFNLQLPIDKSIKYEDVEFVSPKNKMFDKIKIEIKGREDLEKMWNEFVETEGASVAIVRGLRNDNRTLEESIREVQIALDHINNKLSVNAYPDPYEIRWTSDFKGMCYIWRANKASKQLSENDIEKLKDDNLLDDNPSNAAKSFLLAEKIYNQALTSNNISDYWQYLECIIPLKLENRKYKKQVKSACASILFLNYRKSFKNHIAINLFNLLSSNFGRERTENHFSQLETLIMWKNYNAGSVLKESKYFEKHPIVEELRTIYNQRNVSDNIKDEYRYFYSVIHELYEIRNTHVHSGITDEYAEKKMSLIIPRFVKIIRREILEEIKKHKRIEMERVVEKIVKKSQKYCPYKVNKHGELVHI